MIPKNYIPNGVKHVRKSIREITESERSEYVYRVTILKKSGVYDKFVAEHHKFSKKGIHGTDIFLPWHRIFVRKFEEEMRLANDPSNNIEPNPNYTLPYWDWENDHRLAKEYYRNLVWHYKFMGGNGDPNDDNKIKTGPFAGYWPPNHIKREMSDVGQEPELPSPTDVESCILDYTETTIDKKFSHFRKLLERYHNRVHRFVGGDMSRFHTSANDPVFWLHHCNVDRIWAQWQTQHSAELTDANSTYPDLDHVIEPWNEKVRDVIDYRQHYRYQLYEWNKDPIEFNTGNCYNSPFIFHFRNRLYITYMSDDNRMFMRESMDGGSFFKDEYKILEKDQTSDKPSAAVYRGKMYVAFVGHTGARQKILLSASDDAVHFEMGKNILPNDTTNNGPSVVSFNDKLHVYFRGTNDRLYFAESNNGSDWPSNSTQILHEFKCYDTPSALEFENRLYLAFLSNNNQIYVASRDINGYWTTPQFVKYSKATPRLLSYNNRLCILYYDTNDNSLSIIKPSSTDDDYVSDIITQKTIGEYATGCLFNNQLYVAIRNPSNNRIGYYHTYLF
ncbi:tyrosinase [Heterostelium album PN500]|uniref:Tyrosinase n=1 Tax=Heterostelium pallidum (strain ATCC 26659 / Pp 5 / PN500) TaxID=670386 RepID=D3BV93_HETP5|nr:tyrosinase [Heterostelium album PN500]EFA74650.1 tyrosinase [Heterostelium album PN500]|eukprot:XP_020426784.1 tyrosinase [Heterostelium album PN500]